MARECIPECSGGDCQCSAAPASGGFRRARGILAGALGDELPEVRIRRLRDASDDLSAIVRAKALADVEQERVRQDAKWGEQNHNPVEWLSVLAEEVGEAAQAANNCHWAPSASWRAALRHELVQVAAVAIAAVECLDRDDARREAAMRNPEAQRG